LKNSVRFFAAILLQLLIFVMFCGCSKSPADSKLKAAAGLPPVAGLAKIIGGDRVEIISVLPPGRTPHDFTPRTETIRQTSSAKLFFTTGMPFENKIAAFMQNRSTVSDVSRGIKRIAFHDGGDHDHQHHDGCSHDDHDPHVWLSPQNAIIIAENILADLTRIDPEGKDYYQKNFDLLKERLQQLDKKISEKLAPCTGKTFFVYHPAFGYFASAYKLHQRAIELNGREATGPQLAQIIREAKRAGASTIFVQEQFNPRSAESLAKQINGVVAPLDPLAGDLVENLNKIADKIVEGFKRESK